MGPILYTAWEEAFNGLEARLRKRRERQNVNPRDQGGSHEARAVGEQEQWVARKWIISESDRAGRVKEVEAQGETSLMHEGKRGERQRERGQKINIRRKKKKSPWMTSVSLRGQGQFTGPIFIIFMIYFV